MTEVECEYCGESFKQQGIASHQRYCDDAEEDKTTVDPDYSELEEAVLERDEASCVRCAGDDRLVVHQINPEIGEQRSNLVTLCAGCEAEIDGLHHRTKRTKILEE